MDLGRKVFVVMIFYVSSYPFKYSGDSKDQLAFDV